jgi:predicted SnoaL-like aldol condensation-catalyzing enzyme
MDLHRFIAEYTEAVYHQKNPEAAGRFIADPCIRHEHGHREVMTLEENKARIGGFLASVANPRFRFVSAAAEGELYASAYEFTFETDTGSTTLSGIEIFRIQDGRITETWNSPVGEGPWG